MGLGAVELVLATEETFGIEISDALAAEMQTPADLIDHVKEAVHATDQNTLCISQVMFYKVRSHIIKALNCRRIDVRTNTPLRQLFRKSMRGLTWERYKLVSGNVDLPELKGLRYISSYQTVRDLVHVEVMKISRQKSVTRSWSKQEVRAIVRIIISEQLGVSKFSDNASFVSELGMD